MSKKKENIIIISVIAILLIGLVGVLLYILNPRFKLTKISDCKYDIYAERSGGTFIDDVYLDDDGFTKIATTEENLSRFEIITGQRPSEEEVSDSDIEKHEEIIRECFPDAFVSLSS